MVTKDVYMEQVKRQLASWDGEIEHLDAKADIILLQLEEKYYTLLRTLRGKEKEIMTGLQQLKAADEEAWQLLQPVLEVAANDMKLALSTAEQELQGTLTPR
jgi:S-adenosylhomocysteine hydrolase